MYFADLTDYTYGEGEPAGVVNIGWLSRMHSFPVATPTDGLVDALRWFAAAPMNVTRGSHICEFCPEPPMTLSRGGIPTFDPPPQTRGNGEIRVPGADGRTYAAPVLIAHYVEAHGYAPPREFVDAVLAAAAARIERFVETMYELHTADARDVELDFKDGELRLRFVDWVGRLVDTTFRSVLAFRWQERDSSGAPRDDVVYQVLDSKWLASHASVFEGNIRYAHYKLAFNACGTLDVLCEDIQVRRAETHRE